ncbi:MAG: 3-dehydroquinate synthase [Dysgonomonas sp.]
MGQRIIKTTDISEDLRKEIQRMPYDKLFVLTDTNTEKVCLPLLKDVKEIKVADKIVIKQGDDNKNIDALMPVWKYLSDNYATRNSLVVNLGGGMLTDLGGFACSTFKRGVRFINIPTTLLGAVDAAVGGKTGINFNGLKNEIGAFAAAESVIVDSNFFRTLDHSNFLSGYAEMLKHSLIDTEKEWIKIMNFDVDNINYVNLLELVIDSISIKERIVKQDPFEKNIRKALNLGHTVGHAFESLSYEIKHPLAHGYAVAWGIVCELYLSHKLCGFPKDKLIQTVHFIKENYGYFPFSCDEYEELYALMKHDKKNESSDKINFTLLHNIGEIASNQTTTKDNIFESIDFLRESAGL